MDKIKKTILQLWSMVKRTGTKSGHPLWACICDCGNKTSVIASELKSGGTQSCGCIKKERAIALCKIAGMARAKQLTKHGKAGTRLYNIWKAMRERCNNPNDRFYTDYGGRGIQVCSNWDDFETFYHWAMAHGYNPEAAFGECTIDRINVNGNYEPNNCRWVNLKIQAKNRRPRRKEASKTWN